MIMIFSDNKKAIAITMFFSSVVFAKDVCTEKNMTADIDSCYANMKNSSEVALNKEYGELKNRISESYSTDKITAGEYSNNLFLGQRSWLKYRDYQCSMEALFADKNTPANSSLVNKCISRIDEQRIAEMKVLPY